MRAALLAAVALTLTGCAGWRYNVGYDFDAKRFFAVIETPLDAGLKK